MLTWLVSSNDFGSVKLSMAITCILFKCVFDPGSLYTLKQDKVFHVKLIKSIKHFWLSHTWRSGCVSMVNNVSVSSKI